MSKNLVWPRRPTIFGAVALWASILSLGALAQARPLVPATTTAVAASAAAATHYRKVQIDGLSVFYREAGPADAPAVLLLHGFPASSFMYRDLITKLGDRYHVIAPDYPGFGYSAAPSTEEFRYTFDALTDVIAKFTDRLGLVRYAIYMQDFGGPVGFRLASRRPERVSALVVQNANAYEEGLPESFWTPLRTLWKDPTPENFAKIREAAISDAALEWNYTHGAKDPERINPDSWVLQRALINRPGNKDILLALLYDYRTNLGQYTAWHQYFRRHQPPTLLVWGEYDVIFPAVGARAYLRDLPKAELHLLDTGHFALEDKGDEVAHLIRYFLDRNLRAATRSKLYSDKH
jgi:pimeloyl-ACP methyl ester carboxylesterase